MSDSSQIYLREVLGVSSIVVPEGEVAHFQVSGDFSAPVAVVSFRSVSLSERELCQKMLMAVGLGPFLLIEFQSADPSACAEFFKAYQGRGLWIFGEAPQNFLEGAKGLQALTLPWLSELTDQSDPEALMAKKKSVWESLKQFQQEFGAQ